MALLAVGDKKQNPMFTQLIRVVPTAKRIKQVENINFVLAE